jgi:hypothetical protein
VHVVEPAEVHREEREEKQSDQCENCQRGNAGSHRCLARCPHRHTILERTAHDEDAGPEDRPDYRCVADDEAR